MDGRVKKGVTLLTVLLFLDSLMELVSVAAIPGLILLVTFPDKVTTISYIGPLVGAFIDFFGSYYVIASSAALILIYLLKLLFKTFLNYIKGNLTRHFQVNLSNRLYAIYLKSKYEFLLGSNMPELLRNVNAETSQIVEKVVLKSLMLITSIFMTAAMVTLLLFVDVAVSLLTVVLFALLSLTLLRATRNKIKSYGVMLQEYRRAKNRVVMNGLNLIKEIKVLKVENFFVNRHRNVIAQEGRVLLFRVILQSLPRGIVEFGGALIIGLVIIYFAAQGKDPEEMIAILVLFTVASTRLRPLTTLIAESINEIRFALPSVETVYDDITRVQLEEPGGDFDFGDLRHGHIEIRELGYSYDGKMNVLDKISLTVQLGASIGFVGASGSGKSTLINCLMGLLQVKEGAILCNGHDTRRGMASWRRQVGYIPQHITLINDTIINNICLGVDPSKIDPEKLDLALEQSHVKEFLDSLPNGIETLVGDRGVRLSGGQIQRVGIARALYSRPSILVMDEATSALDNITEKVIIEAINELKASVTTITIAHRLTTVQDCDQIYFMEKGRIIDSGSYDELLEKNAKFRELSMAKT